LTSIVSIIALLVNVQGLLTAGYSLARRTKSLPLAAAAGLIAGGLASAGLLIGSQAHKAVCSAQYLDYTHSSCLDWYNQLPLGPWNNALLVAALGAVLAASGGGVAWAVDRLSASSAAVESRPFTATSGKQALRRTLAVGAGFGLPTAIVIPVLFVLSMINSSNDDTWGLLGFATLLVNVQGLPTAGYSLARRTKSLPLAAAAGLIAGGLASAGLLIAPQAMCYAQSPDLPGGSCYDQFSNLPPGLWILALILVALCVVLAASGGGVAWAVDRLSALVHRIFTSNAA
jgi:hypothetical protein